MLSWLTGVVIISFVGEKQCHLVVLVTLNHILTPPSLRVAAAASPLSYVMIPSATMIVYISPCSIDDELTDAKRSFDFIL